MFRIKVFDLKISSTIFRFYLMVAVVAFFVFIHQIALATILGFTIGLSSILGVSFKWAKKEEVEKVERKIIPLEKGRPVKQAG